jgi:hypothetical protein
MLLDSEMEVRVYHANESECLCAQIYVALGLPIASQEPRLQDWSSEGCLLRWCAIVGCPCPPPAVPRAPRLQQYALTTRCIQNSMQVDACA